MIKWKDKQDIKLLYILTIYWDLLRKIACPLQV